MSFCLLVQLKGVASFKPNFHKIELEDGLTDNRYNNFIFEDSRGYVWISSIDGLNRYDGMHIKTYRFESGLKTNNIQSDFFEDKYENIWFTTYDGINCYNARFDTIYNFGIMDEYSDYQAFFLDKKKNYLWLKAGESIYKYDIINKTSEKHLLDKISSKKIKVKLDKSGRLVRIATRLDKNNILFIDPNESGKTYSYSVPNFANFTHLNSDKWIFNYKSSIFIFDEKNPEKILSLQNDSEVSIFDIVKYNEDLLFFSTLNNGICIYNWKEEKLKSQFLNSNTGGYSLSTNSPKQLYLSPSGYLWTSHKNQGVDYAFIGNGNFKNPFEDVLDENIGVTSVAESKDGNIWVSSRRNGVFVFSLTGEYLHQFEYPSYERKQLWQIIEYKNGAFLGITDDHIYHFDLSNKKIKDLTPKFGSNNFRFITKVFPNRYLISSKLGIIEIVENIDNDLNLKFCEEFVNHKEFSFTQIYQAIDKKVFVPYNANELWIYQAALNDLSLSKKLYCNLEFYGFCGSKNELGSVWVGTSKGLKKIDSNYQIISEFNDNSELSSGNIYGIVEDNKGILWISTNKGLWQYDPLGSNNKAIYFDESDGLSGSVFSLFNSSLQANDGSIWLGNNKGLVKFHPDSIKVHKEIPKLHLDQLLVNDTKSFRKKIEDHTLVLEHNQNTLTFDIKAVNLYKTKRNKIYYQLTGYDEEDDTFQINNGEKIRYTKIKPGEYELYAYAEDANGHKSEVKKLLDLKINAPWWLTKPYLILYTLLSAFITYALLKWRENYIVEAQNKKAAVEQLKAQVKLEEETKRREIEQVEAQALLKQQAQKTEIAELETQVLEVQMTALRVQMNPHFLFNSLNSIKSLILKTQEKEASTYLSKFSTLLRSILNNSEKPKIRLSEEIEALRLYIDLEALRFANDFNYQIQIDKTIDSSFIRIPPLLLQPFVENAIWHGLLPKTSGNNKLNINIIRNEDFLFFEIEDNGVGRTKATTLPKKENRKSMGINITKKRIQLLHPDNDIEIIDLVDHHQQALGTKVVIQLFAPE